MIGERERRGERERPEERASAGGRGGISLDIANPELQSEHGPTKGSPSYIIVGRGFRLVRSTSLLCRRSRFGRKFQTSFSRISSPSAACYLSRKVSAGPWQAVAEGDRIHALYTLALSVGMREGELFGLTWPNVNLKDGTLQVTQQLAENNGHPCLVKPKTKSAVRQIDLPAIALTALREHCQRALADGTFHNALGLVFTDTDGKPMRRSNFLRREFFPLLERAGIFQVEKIVDPQTGQPVIDPATGEPKTGKVFIRFHDLRHTCATLALKEGIPAHVVSRMLGHARVSITMDLYAHVLPGQGKEAARTMDAVFAAAKARA